MTIFNTAPLPTALLLLLTLNKSTQPLWEYKCEFSKKCSSFILISFFSLCVGGKAANFLDVGGGASATQVQKAFEILNADKKVINFHDFQDAF